MSEQPVASSSEVGTVYGTVLNDKSTVARLSAAFTEPPYKAAPKAPVFYIKPRNTHARDGASVAIPTEPGRVRIDSTIGAVIGRRASAVAASNALDHVMAWRIVSDVTLPHDDVYRPAIRERCRDGFCPMSEPIVRADLDLSKTEVVTSVNGAEVHRYTLNGLVRPLPELIAEVTQCITLEPGDVLLVGVPEGAPTAVAGDEVEIEVEGLGVLKHRIVAEGVEP